jgi:hypothetical protein
MQKVSPFLFGDTTILYNESEHNNPWLDRQGQQNSPSKVLCLLSMKVSEHISDTLDGAMMGLLGTRSLDHLIPLTEADISNVEMGGAPDSNSIHPLGAD